MGVHNSNLGEYKVELSVDYKSFNEGMQKAKETMTKIADSMKESANLLSMQVADNFAKMSSTIHANLEQMKQEVGVFSSSLKEKLNNGADIGKKFGEDIGNGISEGVSKETKSGNKAEKELTEYAKRTMAKVKAASEIATNGAISPKTFGAYTSSDTNIKIAETALNAVRKTQTELNKLAEQYNAIQEKVGATMEGQGKLASTTLANYRSQLASIISQYTLLADSLKNKLTPDFKATGLMPNYLSKGGVYDQYLKNLSGEEATAKAKKKIDELKQKYVYLYNEVQHRIQSTGKMSEQTFYRLNRQIDKTLQEMRRLGDRSDLTNPLAAQFGRNYGNYLDIKGFNKNLDASIDKTNALADGFRSLKHHITWMLSATALGATIGLPASVVASYKDTERQMAGMIQVLPQLHHNQAELNRTAEQFIGIAQRYGMSVHEIIEAGKQYCPIAA